MCVETRVSSECSGLLRVHFGVRKRLGVGATEGVKVHGLGERRLAEQLSLSGRVIVLGLGHPAAIHQHVEPKRSLDVTPKRLRVAGAKLLLPYPLPVRERPQRAWNLMIWFFRILARIHTPTAGGRWAYYDRHHFAWLGTSVTLPRHPLAVAPETGQARNIWRQVR